MTELITSPVNIRYLSGFTGSISVLLKHNGKSYLFVDGRYTRQARSEVKKGTSVIEIPLGSSHISVVAEFLKARNVKSIDFEDDKMDVASFNTLKRISGIKSFNSISKQLRDERCVKNKKEIELVKKAALIADLTYDCVMRIVKAGQTEREISAHLDYLMKTFRAESSAFETLVSSGSLSAFPHGKPTDKMIKKGDTIVLDFGARYCGYNSDTTRMISIGQPSKDKIKMFNTVLKAQESAISKVKHGVSASLVDITARNIIQKEGFGKYFKHATGHGIGLAVHEGPRVSKDSKDILKEGMIITVEPGIYIPNVGGFRIEDMVLVKRSGFEVLTRSPKKLAIA